MSEQTFTQAQFWAWVERRPPSDINSYELIDGRIVMTPPAGWPNSEVQVRLVRVIGNHVADRALGHVLGTDPGVDLPGGDTCAPDAVVVLEDRWRANPPTAGAFVRLVPNLAAEVVSASSRKRDTVEKLAIYAREGVDEYWLVDQEQLTITILHRQSDGTYDGGEVFRPGDTLRSRVLPHFAAAVNDILLVE